MSQFRLRTTDDDDKIVIPFYVPVQSHVCATVLYGNSLFDCIYILDSCSILRRASILDAN